MGTAVIIGFPRVIIGLGQLGSHTAASAFCAMLRSNPIPTSCWMCSSFATVLRVWRERLIWKVGAGASAAGTHRHPFKIRRLPLDLSL